MIENCRSLSYNNMKDWGLPRPHAYSIGVSTMFGYVKPLLPELKVKDSEVYRAYYCGLCRALGGYGLGSRAALTYDGAYLALLLASVTEEEAPVFTKHGCALHPLRGKTPMAEATPALDYCAALCALLAKYKLQDDVHDGRPLRRYLMPAFAAGSRRAAAAYPEMEAALRRGLARLTEIEDRCEPDPDAAPLLFGGLMAELVCAFPGLTDDKRPIMAELCRAVGGYIYAIDAWDDREKDKKRGCYNIFNLVAEKGFTSLPDGRFEDAALAGASPSSGEEGEIPGRQVTEPELREMCEAMLDMYINSAVLAYDLLDLKTAKPLLDNIMYIGLGARAAEVLEGGTKRRREKEKTDAEGCPGDDPDGAEEVKE